MNDDYPEHDKLAAIADRSQAIGEFLDTCSYVLCKVVDEGNNGEPRYLDRNGEPTHEGDIFTNENPAFESWRSHYAPVGSIHEVLAEYFEIDRDAIEREKRAMIESLRTANAQRKETTKT